ncbi:DUF6864 domain-containing function [Flavobacterium sp. GP15]|uniref:DUF6864 domain-containing function n=1 Tax=Flavobacterium sp. GP15 TaxID=2758567 RepID=UPI00165DD25C|nr:hypothetical protein [Flavobacterium sp. GP15]
MIIATSKDGFDRRVIFNDTILMVDSDDKLSVFFNDEKLKLEMTINFTFSDDGEELKTSGNFSEDGKTINMTLHKWNNSLGTEVTKPIELSTNIGKRIWIKFKTSADKKLSFRSFHLTIWGEE